MSDHRPELDLIEVNFAFGWRQRALKAEAEVERLKAERDRFQAYVHAVQPVLDPAAIGRDAEHYGREVRRLQKAEAELAALRGEGEK